MRINKFISETGYCSRREADALVQGRKVTINGRVATLGSEVEPDDIVKVNGRVIAERQKPNVYLALYKPAGITSTTDQHDPTNIVDYVGHEQRIFPIGRLDKDSEGLILMTSDGDIVNKILRQEGNHEKEYIVTVDKPITAQFVRSMANGVRILGAMTKKCFVEKLDDRTFRIILTQGLNRQIRRMCEVFGYEVKRLQRIRIMNIQLEGMKPGQWRDLSKAEMTELFEDLDYDKPIVAPEPPAPRVEKAPAHKPSKKGGKPAPAAGKGKGKLGKWVKEDRPPEKGGGPRGKDQRGRDGQGYEQRGKDQRGRDGQGYEQRGKDQRGRDGQGYEQRGKDQRGRDGQGYEQRGKDQRGRDGQGYEQRGKDQRGGRNQQGKMQQGREPHGDRNTSFGKQTGDAPRGNRSTRPGNPKQGGAPRDGKRTGSKR